MKTTKVTTYEVRFHGADWLVDAVVSPETVRVFSLRKVPVGARGCLVIPFDPDASPTQEAARIRTNRENDRMRGGQTFTCAEPAEGQPVVALSGWSADDRRELYALLRSAASR